MRTRVAGRPQRSKLGARGFSASKPSASGGVAQRASIYSESATRELEHHLGANLFERTNGGTRPTAAGLEFLKSARRILGDVDAVVQRVRSRSHGEHGRLTIGIYASLSTGNMYATLAEHRRRFPDVDVHTVDGGCNRLLDALAGDVVDIAVMTSCRSSWGDRTLPLWAERVIAALPERHRLPERGVIGWQELIDERILLPQNGPGPELERLLINKLGGIAPQRILRQEAGLDRLLSLVSAGHGALLMLEGGTGVRYGGVVYREVHEHDRPLRLDFTAYWQQSNNNPTLSGFLDMLRERYPELSATPAAG